MSTAASVTGYSIRLRSRREVAERTLAFQFDKPAGFTFKAGQYIDMTLIDPPETDALGNVRAFSIASAPHEDGLMFATRIRDSAFKRVLAAMKQGVIVRIDGPFGNLVLHNNPKRPAALLAGGIGITPFRSIVLRAVKENLPHRIFLFYSNRRPEDAPFLQELSGLESQSKSYRFVGTITKPEKSHQPWRGETGYITGEMLSHALQDVESPIYYIAGPPSMVSGLRTTLNSRGVDDDDIRTEDFSGY